MSIATHYHRHSFMTPTEVTWIKDTKYVHNQAECNPNEPSIRDVVIGESIGEGSYSKVSRSSQSYI